MNPQSGGAERRRWAYADPLSVGFCAAVPAFVNGPMQCLCPSPGAVRWDDLRFCWHCKVWYDRYCAAAHKGICLNKEERDD